MDKNLKTIQEENPVIIKNPNLTKCATISIGSLSEIVTTRKEYFYLRIINKIKKFKTKLTTKK